MGCHVEALCEG